MKSFWVLFSSCLLLQATISNAQDNNYNVAFIPDSLKANADVVKRYEELHVMIKGIDKAIIKHKYALTIMNEAGESYAVYHNQYSKLYSLSDISGHMYDASGKLIKTIKKKDIGDVSATDGDELMSDTRIKHFAFYNKEYPYTVEFEDEEVQDGTYFLTAWTPIIDDNYAVQQSKFIVETPVDYQLRYKQINYPSVPSIVTASKIIYTWEVKNKQAIKYEIMSPPPEEVITSVYIAPATFSFGGYKGDMTNWESLGKFHIALNAGRDQLPDAIKTEVHRLTNNLTSNDEKIKVLYKYLQQNTRYISIQLGIGGWQPLDATFVANKKFGDCKALSNFMVSLLKEAGIPANYVIIRSSKNSRGLWEDFAAPYYFNHIVVCVPNVPNANDTTWLECTSQTTSAGFMGTSTCNRKALMVTDKGGVLVNTPHYTAEANQLIRKVSATINESGTLVAEVNTRFTGLQQERPHGLMYGATQKEKDEYLNTTLNLPTYKVEKINYVETKNNIPIVDEHLTITSDNYASITGKRLFVQPNLFSKEAMLPTDKPRTLDIVYHNSYIDIDSISIAIPAGYIPEAMPKEVAINNKFGSYSIQYQCKNDSIALVRRYKQVEGRFPAQDYTALAAFYEQMFKSDRAKIVLVKKS